MRTILLYGHAGNHNRGCEAIVRGTRAILKAHVPTVDISVASNDYMVDRSTNLGPELKWIPSRMWPDAMRRLPIRHLAALERKLLRRANLLLLGYRPTVEASADVDAAFSVGGDNYSDHSAVFLTALDQQVRRRCKRMVLWGCSLDPQLLHATDAKAANVKAFDLITARESITYQGLLDHGISSGVYLHTDPAFVMQPEQTPLPRRFVTGNTIGINLSPLVQKFEAQGGRTLHCVGALIEHIMHTTDASVLLVPHVVSGSDDRRPLSQLYERFRETPRVILLDGTMTSPQTKYVISQCSLFIGARTHSTIAAYSTEVPTLALGYSVKARGIARDIFGSEEGLVLPVQTLTDERQLIHAFDGLCEREYDLRCHLSAFMPDYIQSAWDAGARVADLLS